MTENRMHFPNPKSTSPKNPFSGLKFKGENIQKRKLVNPMQNTQNKRPVQKEDLFRLKSLMDGRLSPKGDRIVYVISHVNAEKEEEYAALWLYDLLSGQARQLTSGTSRDYSPVWSPDGSQIAFVSTREETPQIYLISLDGGEARRLTSLKNGVGEGPLWSPDGSRLAFTAAKEIEMPDYSKPYRVTRHIYRFKRDRISGRCRSGCLLCRSGKR